MEDAHEFAGVDVEVERVDHERVNLELSGVEADVDRGGLDVVDSLGLGNHECEALELRDMLVAPPASLPVDDVRSAFAKDDDVRGTEEAGVATRVVAMRCSWQSFANHTVSPMRLSFAGLADVAAKGPQFVGLLGEDLLTVGDLLGEPRERAAERSLEGGLQLVERYPLSSEDGPLNQRVKVRADLGGRTGLTLLPREACRQGARQDQMTSACG